MTFSVDGLEVKTFVIADTHFGHENIIKLANRPFANAKEMDDVLIDNWNSVVGHTDVVFFLGDFAWKNPEEYFNRLRGYKVLVVGNHDKNSINLPWDNKHQRLSFDGGGSFKRKLVLDHYPIMDWDGRYRGSIHLHGHTHKHMEPKLWNRRCVSAECVNYTPQNVATLIEEMELEKNEQNK